MSAIYFVKCAGRIKIGVSTDVETRLKALATGAAHPLSLLGTIEGDYRLEQFIHKTLSTYRVQGEWFSDCEPTLAVIDSLLRDGPSAIGYKNPPPSRKKPKGWKNALVKSDGADPFRSFFSDSPEMRAFERISAAAGRYVSERVLDTIKRERSLSLVPGTLVNPIIGGYYSRTRWVVAGKMIMLIYDYSGDLNQVAFDAIFDDGELPENVVARRTLEFAQSLKQSLQSLFASDDLSTMNLGDFKVVGQPCDPEWSDAVLISTKFQFVHGRRLAA